jgi:hypothetical protein
VPVEEEEEEEEEDIQKFSLSILRSYFGITLYL